MNLRRTLAALAVAAFVALAAAWPQRMTELGHAYAWPFVALAVLLALRPYLGAALRNRALKTLKALGVEAEFTDQQTAPDTDLAEELTRLDRPAPDADAPQVPTIEDFQLGLNIMDVFAKAFQIQLDLLEHVASAPANAVTHANAVAWLDLQIAARPLLNENRAGWDVPRLISWMVDTQLLAIDDNGAYVVGDAGAALRALFATGYWFAPKLY